MLKPPLPELDPIVRESCLHLLSYFKIDGKPADQVATEGQIAIFAAIVFRFHKFVEIICLTQYGKTLFTALAAIIVAAVQGIVVCIVAPTAEKAKLTMRYFIEHIGDHEIFYKQLEKNTKLERLRQEENKQRIILRNGGGIFALSVDQKNSKKSIEAAMGQGAKIVIPDEAGLIEDDTEATIFRMITGKTGDDKLYCKIGNPFYSAPPLTHFFNDWNNDLYHKIYINDELALKEGRANPEELAIARTKPLYNILFACEFPPEDVIDKQGYYLLVTSNQLKFGDARGEVMKLIQRERDIKARMVAIGEESKRKGITFDEIDKLSKEKVELRKELGSMPPTKLGADIARGKDFNVYVVRKGLFAYVAGKNQSADTMVNVNEIEALIKDLDIDPGQVNIDDTGVGGGVVDRLREIGYSVNGVAFGGSAVENERFANKKAELFWDLGLWIKDGGLLDQAGEWTQITWMKYKQQSGEKKIIFEPKEKLKERTRKSPDHADSLALTFNEGSFIGFV
ncbi:MAG: hypothetical protein NTZ18_03730 [Candidatus Komeilibacteria bacterium]|nr:hypothetical protein [Candidatus Komeilibacteria bacterium]